MSTLVDTVTGSCTCVCDDCGLAFESEGQLANHKRSFCASFKQLSSAGELAEKLAKLRSDQKRKGPVLEDLRSFLRIPGKVEQAVTSMFSEPHKELAVLPFEVFRDALQNREVSAAESRAKLRVQREENLREEAMAQRQAAAEARREKEKLESVITAALQDFEGRREQTRRKERDAARNFEHLEVQAAHLLGSSRGKLPTEAMEQLSVLKTMLDEVKPATSASVPYGSVPPVLSAKASTETGYVAPERLPKKTMRRCLELAEAHGKEHNSLMQKQAALEAERLQNQAEIQAQRLQNGTNSAIVPQILEPDALQKLVEQVREGLPGQSARLKQLKSDQEQLVLRTRHAEIEAGARRRRLGEAGYDPHGADQDVFKAYAEESVADGLTKVTQQQIENEALGGVAEKIHSLWPLEDLGQQGDQAVRRLRKERNISNILTSAAQQNIEGIWRPQGAPPDVRTSAVYDPLDPALAQPRMGSASSSDGSRSPRNSIAPRSRPDSRDPGQPDGKNWFQPVDRPSASQYRPDDGFYIYWDFIVGLPANMHSVRLVYSLWQGRETACEVSATDYSSIDGNGNAIFAGRQLIKDVPGIPGTRIVVEIQGSKQPGAAGPGVPLGWAILGAFGQSLRAGNHRCPLLLPPARVDIDPAAYKWVPHLGQRSALCLRLGLPGSHSRDAHFTVHPMYEGEYAEGKV